MAYVPASNEVAIAYNGTSYVVNLTLSTSDFYVKSAASGAKISVSLDTAAHLFGAEKAVRLLDKWYGGHGPEYYTDNWQQIANTMLEIKALEAGRDLLGKAAGVALGAYLAGFNRETALKSFGNFLEDVSIEVGLAGLTYVVVKDAIGQVNLSYSEYSTIANGIAHGQVIDYSAIKTAVDHANTSFMVGYAAVTTASKLSNLDHSWWNDVADFLTNAVETIIPSITDFSVQQYVGTGNIDFRTQAQIFGWIDWTSDKLGSIVSKIKATGETFDLVGLEATLRSAGSQYQPLTQAGLLDLQAALAGSSSVTSGIVVAPGTATTLPSTPVPAPNSAPVVVGSSMALATGTVLSAVSFWPGIDPEGNPIVSYTINDSAGGGYFQLGSAIKPEGSSFTVTAQEYANLKYVVGAGLDTFTIRASDSGHPAGGATSTFVVSGLNPAAVPAPASYVAQNDTASTTGGHPIVLNVLANDDSHLTKITSLSGHDPQFVGIKPGTQDAIIVAPPSNFSGTYNFSYTATDGHGAAATAQVTVNVGTYTPPANPVDVNHAPVAPALHQTFNVGQQGNINPLIFSYDIDPSDQGGVLQLIGYGSPSHGTLTRSGDLLTYSPAAGFTGDDSFSYTIQDTHSAQATGTITFTVNTPPTVQNDFVTTNPNAPVTFNVLQNDVYSGPGHLTLHGLSFGPQHGTATFTADGQVTYTPTAGYVGIDTFNYLTLDNVGGSATAGIVIAVGSSSSQVGTGGNDILNGTSNADFLQGLGGDDTLSGGAGDDILDGGTGFNYADFSGATASIRINLLTPAVAGDGTIRWDQNLSDDGLGGQDSLRNIQGIIGSQHNDFIECGPASEIVYANGGDDDVALSPGNDTIYLGDGNDRIFPNTITGTYTIYGGSGDDQIVGGSNADYLEGGDGNDDINGLGGIDKIFGGKGNDTITNASGTVDGGEGNDTIRAASQDAALSGGAGDDLLVGADGNDTLLGGDGNDSLFSSQGNDTIDGGAGIDTFTWGNGGANVVIDLASEFVQASSGFHVLRSVEIVNANAATGSIFGSQADDQLGGGFFQGGTLAGRGGNDVIRGGNHLGGGTLTIQGDAGSDTLTGGSGQTRFVYRSAADGADVITDFTTASGNESDVIDFGDAFATSGYAGSTPIHDGYLRLVASGNDTVVQVDADGVGAGAAFVTLATLKNVLPSSLTQANFATTVDVGAVSPGVGPIVSNWSQSISYRRGQDDVSLGSIVVSLSSINVGAEPTTPLTVRFAVTDPTVGSLAVGSGSTYDPVTGIWSIQGTDSQVNAALAAVTFKPLAGHEGDVNISTFISDGVNAPVVGLINLALMTTPTIINGTDGNDSLPATAGDNIIFGGLGTNRVDYGSSGMIGITVDLAAGTASGSNGRHDSLFDIQSVRGTEFGDVFIGKGGSYSFDGAGGIDAMDYSATVQGVTVDLAATTNNATGAEIGTEQVVDVENVIGGSGGDQITGNALGNVIEGRSGEDSLIGGGGDDILIGGASNDMINGGSGMDTAVFDGTRAQFRLTLLLNGSLGVSDLRSGAPEGTDTVSGVELLQFSDMTTGPPLETSGFVSLSAFGSHFYLYGSTGAGPSLKFNGVDVVTGQFGTWTPIGAETTAGGYEVAWKMTGSDQYAVWSADSGGNLIAPVVGAVTGSDFALQLREASFQQDLNGNGTIGLPATAVETNGSISLTTIGNHYLLYGSGGSGPSLKYAGVDFLAGQFGGWTPIGAETAGGGYEVAWKMAGADQYAVWRVDSAGNLIAPVVGIVPAADFTLQAREAAFQQDLNGDGSIGPVATTIEANGSISLMTSANHYFLYGGGLGSSLKYGGIEFVTGQFAGWTPIGAEAKAGGYEVAWKMSGADQYAVWSADSGGNMIAPVLGIVPAADYALQAREAAFQQDLNGDGAVGPTVSAIETNGTISLTKVADHYFLYSGGSGPSLKFGGADFFAGQFGGWTPIGAESTTGGYEVAWKMAGADQYAVWSADSGGNMVVPVVGIVPAADYALQARESIFQQDLNGDGMFGPVTAAIETNGSTSLTKVANHYFLYGNGGSGPSLKFAGVDVLAGQFDGWTPIGAEVTGGGYEVAWKMAGSDQYAVWSANGAGNLLTVLVGPVSGADPALQSHEHVFHQDLNGDGNVSAAAAIVSDEPIPILRLDDWSII